jgi:hypothetical protein
MTAMQSTIDSERFDLDWDLMTGLFWAMGVRNINMTTTTNTWQLGVIPLLRSVMFYLVHGTH